jgi:saccharopine dehydrogenase-like NADP-dependent oxidoreductase
MRKILILGAGRSASSLIQYLVRNSAAQHWRITVADRDMAQARLLVGDAPDAADVLQLDATDPAARSGAIAQVDLVISMLPAFMHMDVLKDCLRLRKNVITPSYVPDALWAMDDDLKAAGLIVLNEMGLDPGIDHMSAMRILDRLRGEGAEMTAFESYCGGLVAPESDDNPWGYKFSWNPRNVILAGQGGAAKYIREGITKYTPYHKLFQRTTRVPMEGVGEFDGYANRDSLKYRSAYGLEKIPTLVRGTLRKAGYCAAWDVFVQLGCTDDSYALELGERNRWSDYLNAFLPHSTNRTTRENLAHYLALDPAGAVMEKLDWLGVFGEEPIGVSGLSPAATLQHLLERKWKLRQEDKDMVVMWHRFRYVLDRQQHEVQASLCVVGTDQLHTAMARTVGLPIAMACKLVLNGAVADRGVLLPLKPEIYDPILDELETVGVRFEEKEVVEGR